MFNTIFPKIHKEGYKFLAISIIATFIILFFSKFIGILFIAITFWVYYFFRDPDRISNNDEDYLEILYRNSIVKQPKFGFASILSKTGYKYFYGKK